MIVSRRQFLRVSAGTVAAVAIAEVFDLSALAQPIAAQSDRPKIEFIFDPDGGLSLHWGPSSGPWGIYTDGAQPQLVDINKWWLYVGQMINPVRPEQGSKAISKGYNGRDMGTTRE